MTFLPPSVHRLFVRLQRQSRERLGVQPPLTVILGVSGGLDSMLLLAFFHWWSKQEALRPVVCHLHHGLRVEADEEAAFVRAQAEERGLDFHFRRVDVDARKQGRGVEAAGREARRAFFSEVAAAYEPPVLIALGHHRNDQAETVLLHLGRGSGLSGLAGMKARDGQIIRPFLDLSLSELQAAQERLDLPYRQDQSNLSRDHLRNRLRHDLLPVWSALLGYDVTPALARFAENVRDDLEALAQLSAAQHAALRLPDGRLTAAGLLAVPPALARRVLLAAYREAGGRGELTRLQSDRLLQAIQTGRNLILQLAGRITAELEDGVLGFRDTVTSRSQTHKT